MSEHNRDSGLGPKIPLSTRPRAEVGTDHLESVKQRFPAPCVCVFSSIAETESTDDDKIISYHWEELKGPLREEKVSSDTAILTLTNLVPGNYTFR